MITKSQAKRKQDIKTKLMAAIAMLLVSSIMMVSSTYAWFTLSTAPEVTGIQTAVGANGNLEMALLPTDGDIAKITSEVGDSMAVANQNIDDANRSWGNLVDLSDTATYGLNNISLYPSEVNIDAAGNLVTGSMLKTPVYGADGRIESLVANTSAATNKGTDGFMPGTGADFGVRGVGVISGMTDRQLDYRNARQAAITASSMAKNTAVASLDANGSALANVVIKKVNSDTPAFTGADVTALNNIIDSLIGDGTSVGALDHIEEAYMQYLLAMAASVKGGTDEQYLAVKAVINGEGATIESVMAKLGEYTNIPEALSVPVGKLAATRTAVADARGILSALDKTDDSYTWTEIQPALSKLANPDVMTVNNMTAAEIKANISGFASSVLNGGQGVTVEIPSGGGVYADIADHCGNFSANIEVSGISYGGVTLDKMRAKMETKSQNNYLNTIAGVFNADDFAQPGDAATGTKPITDMYGYVIDLAFKTNAADSKLLIAKDAVDRIYDGNTNETTMGHGSSMTFKATTTELSTEQVKSLMGAIRILFFNPDDGTIYVKGKLDTTNASIGADGVTAKISLYTGNLGATGETTYVVATGDTVGTHKQVEVYNEIADIANWIEDIYAESEGTYTKIDKENVLEGTTYYSKGFGYESLTEEEKNDPSITKYAAVTSGGDAGDVIMPLGQNTAQKLSVLVYLDGNEVGNDDVAATAAQSVTGTMNLQFKSSATLVPMEYADLHTPAGN